jgi:hypothetical protein
VAQLGARFHGMEEVVSSNLTRSTNHLKITLSIPERLASAAAAYLAHLRLTFWPIGLAAFYVCSRFGSIWKP